MPNTGTIVEGNGDTEVCLNVSLATGRVLPSVGRLVMVSLHLVSKYLHRLCQFLPSWNSEVLAALGDSVKVIW